MFGEHNRKKSQWEKRAKLPNNQPVIVIDVGARLNCIGANTVNDVMKKANLTEEDVAFMNLPEILEVSGVGGGTTHCERQVTLPIAVRDREGHSQEMAYTANIMLDAGNDTPAIWGTQTLQQQDAVFIMRDGKEMLAIPGREGYTINWSPGTVIIPMHKLKTGHFAVPYLAGHGTAVPSPPVSDGPWTTTDHYRRNSAAPSSRTGHSSQ